MSNVANAQTLFKDLNPGSTSSEPESFITIKGTMYFIAKGTGTYNYNIWKTDGTLANTAIVKSDIINTPVGNVIMLINMNDTLYYVVNPNANINIPNPATLWKSDGTTTGTVFLDSMVTASIFSGTGDAQPRNYTVVGNKIFFQMGKGQGNELWVTDGTLGGVHQVIDLAPGAQGNYQKSGVVFKPMIAFKGKVYFQGSTTGTSIGDLYSSDGTAAGTTKIGTGFFQPENWIIYNNELYFNANVASVNELWKTDGTTSGTVKVASVSFGSSAVFKNLIYFQNGINLWKTDGTSGVTAMVTDSANQILGANADYLVTGYMKSTPPYDFIYKRTDGTTVEIVSKNLGATASFTVLDNKMYHGISDGRGLWVTDGTETGTVQLLVSPPNIVNYPYAYKNTIFFNNYGSGTGYELWSYTPSTTTMGISTIQNTQTEINIYPNPSNGTFTFVSAVRLVNLKIYNLLGENIYSEKLNSEKTEINLTNEPKGVYFYQIVDEKNDVKTGKIIIE